MTFVLFTQFVLLLLILQHISSEQPQPMFKEKDNNVEIGYCFGSDYIVVYKSTSEGDQLLGNSSNRNIPDSVPAYLQGRTHITKDHNLLGLQIVNVTHMDSGLYRRECWENQTQLSQQTYQLSVCNEEIESEEIIVNEGGGAELLCHSAFIGLEGISVRWYYEMYPNYTRTLFLDSSISLKPLVEERPGAVEVRDQGARLVVDNKLLRNQNFHCLVFNGTNCLSFQNMYSPDDSDSSEIYASHGEEVVLYCPAEDDSQHWDTPLGKVTGGSVDSKQMHVSSESDFSLVIPVVSDEHTGDYSCLSSTSDFQYSLALCSKKRKVEKHAPESGSVSLKCSLDDSPSISVRWERRKLSGQDELIYDSRDETIAIPVDLKERVTLSEDASKLTISDLKMMDGGEYWCVVLRSAGFLEGDGDYNYDYEDRDEDAEDDYDSDSYYSSDTQSCLSKQVTTLTITDTQPVTSQSPRDSNTRNIPEPSNNVAAIAAGVATVGLLLIGAIIGGIVFRRRATASAQQRPSAPQSGKYPNADVEMQGDRDCTKRLKADDDAAEKE